MNTRAGAPFSEVPSGRVGRPRDKAGHDNDVTASPACNLGCSPLVPTVDAMLYCRCSHATVQPCRNQSYEHRPPCLVFFVGQSH